MIVSRLLQSGHLRLGTAEVVKLSLVMPKLGELAVSSIERDAVFVNYEYSGCGYFLTVRHPDLPLERIVALIA